MSRALVVEDVRWTADVAATDAFRAAVKIRYRTPAGPAAVFAQSDGTARVVFDEPQRAVTPGQAAVFYDGDEVIGGGAIMRAEDG